MMDDIAVDIKLKWCLILKTKRGMTQDLKTGATQCSLKALFRECGVTWNPPSKLSLEVNGNAIPHAPSILLNSVQPREDVFKAHKAEPLHTVLQAKLAFVISKKSVHKGSAYNDSFQQI